MSAEKQSDQTEQPTRKRLQDARKKGDVHRSQDLSRTLVLIVWLFAFGLLSDYLIDEVVTLTQQLFGNIHSLTPQELVERLYLSARTICSALVPFILVSALAGFIVEWLQVGNVFSVAKLTLEFNNLNPAQGIKKLFSAEKLVDVARSIIKTLLVVWCTFIVLFDALSAYLQLPNNPLAAILASHRHSLFLICFSVALAFLFIAILDVFYQRHLFIKKMRMSQQEIKQENKETDGDPLLKNQRKQLHQEWSQQNTLAAVRQANVLVANPTHLAVALYYETGVTDLPQVVAKGQDHIALHMREIAEQAGVPVMENVPLARGLFADVPLAHSISADYFEVVAEVLRWAERIKMAD